MIISAEGIVLKTYNYGEADLMMFIFTDKLGKLSVYGKNARKIKSKIIQNSQVLAYSKMNLDCSGGMYKLHSCELIDNFYNLSLDMEKYYFSFYMLDVINNLIPENQGNSRAFKLLIDILNLLKYNENIRLLKLIFRVKLLIYLGVKPKAINCIECNKGIENEGSFSYEVGGMICSKCRKKENIRADIYDNTTFLLLDYMLENKIEDCLKAKISILIVEELEILLDKYYTQNFG
ncbi:MAG: DNA repair protein RecO [Filifactoraceae bacterium]